MEQIIYQVILWLTFITTALSVAYDINDDKRLSKSTSTLKERHRQELMRRLKNKSYQVLLMRIIFFAYFITLILLAFGVPYIKYLFLALSLGRIWSSYRTGPLLLSGQATAFYEISLTLNGLLLCLLFIM